MDRRAFIGAIVTSLFVPLRVAEAQQSGKAWRIGYLRRTSPQPADIDSFRKGMRELGYVEGQNLVIDERYADGDASRLAGLVQELMQLKVEVLVVDGTLTVRAAREAAGATPIVFTQVGNPVGAGFVKSLDHPGGNITGVTNFSQELGPKRLQLLHEIAPAKRVGVLYNPPNTGAGSLKASRDAAHSLGIELTFLDARSPDDLSVAFARSSRASVEALIVLVDAMFYSQRARLVDLASQYRLPAIYQGREFADAGGLIAYGPSESANFYRAASYVDKILKRVKPGDLPVEQPTKFELVINLKTAKALGLTIPQSMLLRADEVIQ
jgi:putative ABC transport system substrate-binding protein